MFCFIWIIAFSFILIIQLLHLILACTPWLCPDEAIYDCLNLLGPKLEYWTASLFIDLIEIYTIHFPIRALLFTYMRISKFACHVMLYPYGPQIVLQLKNMNWKSELIVDGVSWYWSTLSPTPWVMKFT